MKCFPHIMLSLLLLLNFSSAIGQSPGIEGLWQSSRPELPKLYFKRIPGSLKVYAKGGFLPEKIQARRLQQFTSAGGKKLQVIFFFENKEIFLNIKPIGKNLQASWRGIEDMGGPSFTTYSKVIPTNKSNKSLGMISGKAIGKAKSTASIFQVSLYGPDDNRHFVSTQSLGKDGGFSFDQLPDGEYWLFVEPRAGTIVQAFPSQIKITIREGKSTIHNIYLR